MTEAKAARVASVAEIRSAAIAARDADRAWQAVSSDDPAEAALCRAAVLADKALAAACPPDRLLALLDERDALVAALALSEAAAVPGLPPRSGPS
jgi:hypothetical protein